VWTGSGALSWCTGGTLSLVFRCTGDLIDCEGQPLPGPCDGSGGMCLSGTLVVDGNSCTSPRSDLDQGCDPAFVETNNFGLTFECCENGTHTLHVFVGP
jgi:hypothetical protein